MIDIEKLSLNVEEDTLKKFRKLVLSALESALKSVDPYKSVKNSIKNENNTITI